MSVLDRIIAHKHKEVRHQKEMVPVDILEKSAYFKRDVISLSLSLGEEFSSGIIAEFKRKSPSAGLINEKADPVSVTRAYGDSGAAGLSVLTDLEFFGGSSKDLEQVRGSTELPVLRKEFIIDEYQVLETRALGADAILLIATILDRKVVKTLAKLAKSVGLEVLLEVHEESELDRINEFADLVGVNNRDLKKMVTNVDTSKQLAQKIPGEFVKVSESGISRVETIIELREFGYQGFLIGEFFMKQDDPGMACFELIQQLK